jgi:membrane associated rhomboid family serine protease
VRIGPGPLPPFIKAMLIANVAVFIAQFFYADRIIELFALTPNRFFAEFPALFYQVFTYMFLHGGFAHIFFNMFALWMFGTEIEYAWGSKSFGWFYILCGAAGAALQLAVFPSQMAPVLGASGAIYGILVAYWLLFPSRYLYIYFLFPVQVKWAIPGMMILGFLMGGRNVAHMVHLGGAIFGLLYLKVDWRWAYVGRKLKDLRYRRQTAKLEKKRQEADEIMKRVDAILDKINEVGIENLSKSERKFLEEASSHLSRQKDYRRK